jgi:SAM-dependent methyltransferase
LARITYDDQTAAAYKAVRELPRDGLGEWRDAIRRHLSPVPRMTVVDIGAGTGQFAAAFSDWFGLSIVAVEPSAAMRAHIPRRQGIRVLDGDASALPLPDGSVDGAWLSLVIHHIPDLEAAAREIRRVLRPGAPVLIRQGFSGRIDRNEFVRWFPETERMVDTSPSVCRSARCSQPADSAGMPLSRFLRHGRPASPSSSPRRTPSAAPTARSATSPRRNSSAAKNDSAGPHERRRHPARSPELLGSTF